jgi:hypothetical protein
MDFKLELVLIPVSDVDRAKAFCTQAAASAPAWAWAQATRSASHRRVRSAACAWWLPTSPPPATS